MLQMRKLVYLFILVSTIGYSQTYTGLAGYLNVNNNVWTLTFQNNEYYYLTDPATLAFDNINDVQVFYSDLQIALDTNNNEIIGKGYKLVSTKKNITLYNEYGQYMVIVKKYFKKGLEEINKSIAYME